MTKQKIIIVGVARNLEKEIKESIDTLELSFSPFFNTSFFVVESDSSDETLKKLREIRKSNSAFFFKTLGNLREDLPDRVERIRFCRNACVDYIRQNYSSELWDYIVVADLDGINKGLNPRRVSNILRFNLHWDVLTCNQLGPYYDIYALRANGWVESDCLIEVQNARDHLTREFYGTPKQNFIAKKTFEFKLNGLRKKIVYDKMRFIPPWSNPLEVESAFGGVAIYKTHTILRHNYAIADDVSTECEHVTLHKKISREGGRIFILPPFLNGNWNEHSLNKIWIIRLYRRLKNRIGVRFSSK